MKKLFRMTTIPLSLMILLKGQLKYLNQCYEVTAIASGDNEETWNIIAEREGIKCQPIQIERDISLFKDCVSLIKLYRFFRKERPFIVHANTPKASLLSMIAARCAGVHHRLYTVTRLRFEGEKGMKRTLLVLMEKITCYMATKVIPEGLGVKQTLIKNKITRKELTVLGHGNINGIDCEYFSPIHFPKKARIDLRYQLGINRDDIVFCFVGRLVKDKGINELTRAFSSINDKHSDTKLLLVGPFEKKLDTLNVDTERIITKNPAIISTGFQHDVRPYLSISDIFVFPSYREGFPNVVMQAGSMGLPSIVSDINGCNEIIIEGENGLIIPSKDVVVLQNAMEEMLNNVELREKMANNARAMIVSRYEQQIVWDAILNEYKNLETKN